ncbi:MAG: autotransporter-associated beta strand repeat-containing protein [Chthoniobacterales bacterium]
MKPKNKTVQHLGLIALAFAGVSSPLAHAANDVWIGNTDSNFATLSNWTGSVSPNNNTPVFGTAGPFGTTLNNDLSGATFAGLTFNSGASAFTIGGNSFALTGTITNNSTNTQTINTAMTIAAGRTVTATSGQLVLGGNITGAGGLTLNPTNKITLGGTNNFATNTAFANLTINGGAGGVDITGSTTVGNAANVNQGGYLSVGGTTTVTIQSGGSLAVNGATNTQPASAIGQNIAGTSTILVNGGTLTFGANTALLLGNGSTGSGVLTIASGTATINRGTLATTGAGTDTRLIMMGRDPSAANGNNGTINLNGGTLATDRQFVRDGSTGSANSGTANFVFGGGTLKALGTQTDWLQSTTASDVGQNQGATGGTVNTGALALSSVTTTAVSTIDANGFAVAINSAISGGGGFNINSNTGTGTVTFGGAQSYTGGTTVTAGTLDVTGTLADSGAVTVSGGTYKVSNDDTVGAVTLTSGTISNASGKVLTGSSYAVQSGAVSGILGGSGVLTKSTGGTVTLSGANTYSGGTSVGNGTLTLSGSGTFGSGALTVSGGTANLGGASITNTLGALTGGGAVNNGTITNNSGTYDVQNGSVGAVLAGSNGLTKSTSNTVTLSGANTYGGATLINGGTLALGSTGSISNTSGVSLGTSGTFDVSAKVGGYTVTNLSGSGTVVGSLTVSTQLAIGNSPGTINFGSLTLGSTSTYTYELIGGGSSADLGNVSGSLAILSGSILDLVQLGSYTPGQTFTLFGYNTGSLSGTFKDTGNVTLNDGDTFTDAGGSWLIDYDNASAGLNGGTGSSFVTITSVPEPGAALLGGLGVLALLRRRRVG